MEGVYGLERNSEKNSYDKAMAVLGSLLVSYIITLFMILLLAFVLLKAEPSEKIIQGVVIVIYIMSTFLGGFFIGKKMQKKQYLWGMALGILYFLVVFLIAFTLHKNIIGEMGSMITVFMMCMLGGTLGGMIS